MGSKVKDNHKRMELISEVLGLIGESTSKEIAAKTNMTRLKVQQTLAELQRKGYAVRSDRTGTGNEAVWSQIKPFVINKKDYIDWKFYYQIFYGMVKNERL